MVLDLGSNNILALQLNTFIGNSRLEVLALDTNQVMQWRNQKI